MQLANRSRIIGGDYQATDVGWHQVDLLQVDLLQVDLLAPSGFTLEVLKKQIKNIDSQLAKMLQADTKNKRAIEILGSVKGVGPVMISTVIAELPELGRLNRGEVAKLVGVAPINRDSGKKSAKRFIGGGRGQVRRVLYMATIVAIRHNPAIKLFYGHLKSKGKQSKVAIVACMRKLITILNLLLTTNQVWQEKTSV